VAKQTWELAVEQTHGEWEYCGDFASFGAAAGEAKRLYPHVRVGDNDVAVFGISGDPGSGHYEHRVEIHPDGTCVHSEDGAIVGTL
jgi:hypothetical protein